MTPQPRFFPVASTHPMMLLATPLDDGYWRLVVRRGANPLADLEPTEYDLLTAGELEDVAAAVLADFLGR